MKKLYSLIVSLFLFTTVLLAQVERVEPPFWWAEMPVQELQILLYGHELGHYEATVDYPGVILKSQYGVDSKNYKFLYLEIGPEAHAGTMDIVLKHHSTEFVIPYELRVREEQETRNNGFDASDVIYLMMPDRFANGDPSNDSIEGMLETADRSNPERRQGGDLAGVKQHLDYIKDLGMTAVWFTPIFENDMSPDYGAYHGYAATDMYKVDRRYGSNEEYKTLIDAIHEKGMKVIMDMIHNHIGDNHWWMSDLPTNDWVHDIGRFGTTNYRGAAISDPYASRADKERLLKGWFVPEMPDLNQHNELLADYLIQNTLWWIEFSGIDGIRMDTYFYPDKDYMARWAKEIMEAYPTFNIVGEAWLKNVPAEAYWQYDEPGTDDGYNSHLPSLTDFPWNAAVRTAFNEPFGWETGLSKIYYLLSQDFLYSNPYGNVIFLDNHDMGRIFEAVGKDEQLFKMAYAFLMTSRGIPQVYYGTELMMGHENRGGDDEFWRQTMPGGWPDDERSVFTEEGRTDKENEIITFVSSLTNWRKTAVAVHEGELVHFIPENGVYVFFRVHDEQTIMVVMNSNPEDVVIDRDRFAEILDGFSLGEQILSSKRINLAEDFSVDAKSTSIFELH